MKSVGEVMGIGRTFKESLQKAVSSLEGKEDGFGPVEFNEHTLSHPNSKRIYHVAQAFREGWSVDQVERLTQITPWFLEQIKEIIDHETIIADDKNFDATALLKAKRLGFSDVVIHASEKRRLQKSAISAGKTAFIPVTHKSILAQASLHPKLRITTRATGQSRNRRNPQLKKRSSFSVQVQIGLAKESNSITAAFAA